MTEQEVINNEVQRNLALQDAKFNQFMQEMWERDRIRAEEFQDFKNEMRDRDNRRADEIATVNAKYDAEVKAINAKIDDKFERLLNQLQNMAIAAVVGVGAVVAAVVSIMK